MKFYTVKKGTDNKTIEFTSRATMFAGPNNQCERVLWIWENYETTIWKSVGLMADILLRYIHNTYTLQTILMNKYCYYY